MNFINRKPKTLERFFALFTMVVLVMSTTGIQPVFAVDDKKVTICHATASGGNPYVQETVSVNSIIGGGHGVKGVNEGDIIPIIDDELPGGHNWTTDNQAIYDNDCYVGGKITVDKIVVDSDSVNESDFELFVGDEEVTDGLEAQFLVGTYKVTEKAKDGVSTNYTTTFGEDCANGEITINVGDDKTCTITNTYTPEEPEEKMVTISATKIICPDESLLPNDGYDANIDGNTATTFLDENPTCSLASDWDFQWALGGVSSGNAPDNDGALNSNGWQTPVGTVGGVAMMQIPESQLGNEKTISVREVMKPDYLPFSGTGGSDVSAEIYCTSDAKNYDNLEWVKNVKPDNTYHCVAWNVPPEPEPVATVIAEKVVCEAEEYLPNYNDDGKAPKITDTTATDYVANSNGKCRLEDDWYFEWAPQSTLNPDNDLPENPFYGLAGDVWTQFGPTDGTGKAQVNLTEEDINGDSAIWVREVLQDNYIPFTYGPGNLTNADNVTAELYCHIDGKNYDNYDRVDGITVDETYHCVAWNVPTKPQEPRECTVTLVSGLDDNDDKIDDATTVVEKEGAFAKLLSTYHTSWSALISGAKWIWGDDPVAAPVDGEKQNFIQKFGWNGPVTSAKLTIAADNTFVAELNGNEIGSDLTEFNYKDPAKEYNIAPELINQGNNEFGVEVYNMFLNSDLGNPVTNPAGLLYKLEITGEDSNCDIPYVEEPKVCVISSDETTLVEGEASTLTWVHKDWTKELESGDAEWIWDDTQEPLNGETLTFTKTFNVDSAPTSATLKVAADNSYVAKLNGNPLTCDGSGSKNYLAVDTCSAPVISGVNTLTFEATNDPYNTTNEQTNPAGLIYELTIDGSSCSAVPTEIITSYQCDAGLLFLDTETQAPEVSTLYTVDDSDGSATFFADYDLELFPVLAVSEDEIVYSIDKSTGELVTLDDDTGAYTVIGTTGLTSAKPVAMEFAPDGTLYALTENNDALYEINPTNGVATKLHDLDLDVAGGDVVFKNSMIVYVRNQGQVYGIDSGTYDETLLGTLSVGSQRITSAASKSGVHYAYTREDGFYPFTLNPFVKETAMLNTGPFAWGDGSFCPANIDVQPDPWCSYDGVVIDYTSNDDAKRNNGELIDANRRLISALNSVAPYINDDGKEEDDWDISPLDFFSLGIGGFLTYEFTGQVAVNQAGPDIAIYEITGGPANEQSDEKIEVEVSQNGTNWFSLGDYTGDAMVDIAPAGFEYVKFVRLTDKSQGVQGDNGDGYDVDAVVILNGRCENEPTNNNGGDDTQILSSRGGGTCINCDGNDDDDDKPRIDLTAGVSDSNKSKNENNSESEKPVGQIQGAQDSFPGSPNAGVGGMTPTPSNTIPALALIGMILSALMLRIKPINE